MADEMIKEKVYCYGHPGTYANNDSALLAAAMCGKRDNDPMAMMAAMNGGLGNQWMNNPFAYIMFMAIMNRMWGNGWDTNGQNAQNIELQNQIQSLRSQIADNQNSGLIMDAVKGNGCAINQLASNLNCDFNTLNSAICDVRQGIAVLAGKSDSNAERVINSIANGNLQMTMALKDCCCQTQQNIIRMGYENQLGQKDIQYSTQKGFCDMGTLVQSGFDRTNTGLERGFASVAYETQKQTCDIINAGKENTQRILDTLNGHWTNELSQKLQDQKFENSQLRQNVYLGNLISGTTSVGGNIW